MNSHVEAYREALMKELHEKERLLFQARQASQRLQREIENHTVDHSVWNELAERQLYVPSRADPIGIASLKQSVEAKDQQQLSLSSLSDLQTLVESQRRFNNEMSILLRLLVERSEEACQSVEKWDCSTGMSVLRVKLEKLVRNHLAFDIAQGDLTPGLAAEEILSLLDRLLSGDKALSQDDFSPYYMSLFRLLDKAYLLEKSERDGKIFVELTDFK